MNSVIIHSNFYWIPNWRSQLKLFASNEKSLRVTVLFYLKKAESKKKNTLLHKWLIYCRKKVSKKIMLLSLYTTPKNDLSLVLLLLVYT